MSDLQNQKNKDLKSEDPQAQDLDRMMESAKEATDFLKALAHEGRLVILCYLVDRDCSVAELEVMLSARQAAVSQQLARLRMEGLVSTRREGRTIYYSLSDKRVKKAIRLIYDLFC